MAVIYAQEVTETTPKQLYVTAALLIREGIITLEDLYPHVSTCICVCICLAFTHH